MSYKLHFSEIFTVGRWKKNLDLPDELKDLANSLPDLCLKSRSANTVKQYRYAFNNFSKWCQKFYPDISALPASDFHVSLYLAHLVKTGSSAAKIQSVSHAISWVHSVAGVKNPCDSELVKCVKEGAVRDTSRPVEKKEPIEPEHLCLIIDIYAHKNCSLSDLRIACMCTLAYAAFLRFSELSMLTRGDINIFEDHIIIHIVKSKTDKYRNGCDVYVARTGTKTCPVSILERYMQIAKIENSEEFLFRSITLCKKRNYYMLRKCNKPISYTRAREIILNAFENIGLEKCKFGLHSLRSGGATAAASAGISDRLFKKHGRWRSDSAKDGYVKENILQKLIVTKSLGI